MIHTLSIQWLSRKILVLLVLIVLLFTILEIWAVNRLATSGEQINKLEVTKSALALENQLLKNQIAQKASLFQIEKETKNRGYLTTRQFLFIHENNLALNR